MRIISAAVSVVFASLMVLGEANGNTFRAVPARRTQTVLPDWPLARIISHAGLPRKEWCLAAKKGVSDGDPVGLEECDDPITASSTNQLWLLTGDGKIRSALDLTQCIVIDDGTTPINRGHSRARFLDCDATGVQHITFTHNRVTDFLRVTDSPSFCLKQQGNAPQSSDPILAFTCDANDQDFVFTYLDYRCSTSLGDVSCCDNVDCSANEICENYACVVPCSTLQSGVQCCVDSDCGENQFCANNVCIAQSPSAPCSTSDFGVDCCVDADCPVGGQTCNLDSNTCLTQPFFIVNTINNQDFCVSANRGLGDFVQVGSELCEFDTQPARQLWLYGADDKIHSNINKNHCLISGPGADVTGGIIHHITSCRANLYAFEQNTNAIRLGQDLTKCLKSNQDGSGGSITGVICAANANDASSNFVDRNP